LFHGLSTGFKPTATSAYIADIAPPDRRGEAMGILGLFSSIGMASGPVIGSYIALYYSLNAMFYASSVLALASVIVLIGMKETLKDRESFKPRLLKIKSVDILEPRVYSSSFVLMLNVFAFGVILTVIPDLTVHLGLTNKGVFFAIFTITSLMIRIFAGQASDRYGRVPLLKIASVIIITSLILISLSDNLMMFYIAAGLYGVGVGISTPTAYAWTIDLSEEKHRGRALATMFIALETGIGGGALISAWIYNNNANNFPITFLMSASMSAIALIYLFYYAIRHKRISAIKVPVLEERKK
jgi:MFS family permease